MNLYGNYPHYPNYLQFLKRPHHHSEFILCAWYTIWVSILIKSIVLCLFLAFITLSDLYYPHHPPSEGCTFRSRKKGILCVQQRSWALYALHFLLIDATDISKISSDRIRLFYDSVWLSRTLTLSFVFTLFGLSLLCDNSKMFLARKLKIFWLF